MQPGGGMEQDRFAIPLAEFSKHALQRAGGTQHMRWPVLAMQSCLFLNGVERQGILKISGQRWIAAAWGICQVSEKAAKRRRASASSGACKCKQPSA